MSQSMVGSARLHRRPCAGRHNGGTRETGGGRMMRDAFGETEADRAERLVNFQAAEAAHDVLDAEDRAVVV